MANGHGGARPGAGRPRKPLAEKIRDGNPGKRRAKVLDIAYPSTQPPEPPEDIGSYSLEGFEGMSADAESIFKETVAWLETTGCLHLINPALITEYAILKSRWLECEQLASRQFIWQGKVNPLTEVALKYIKAASATWSSIWNIVAQNSETYFGDDPNDGVMLSLLKGKPKG